MKKKKRGKKEGRGRAKTDIQGKEGAGLKDSIQQIALSGDGLLVLAFFSFLIHFTPPFTPSCTFYSSRTTTNLVVHAARFGGEAVHQLVNPHLRVAHHQTGGAREPLPLDVLKIKKKKRLQGTNDEKETFKEKEEVRQIENSSTLLRLFLLQVSSK